MTVTVASFRGHFVEFADAERYPNAQVAYWLQVAGLLLNVQRWGRTLDLGTELFIAHNTSIERIAMDEAGNGGVPGVTKGPVNSESVDKVSVGYDVASGIELDAGHWNNTIYGTRFIRLARMHGAGPIQVGMGCPLSPLSSANAWYGPWAWNFPNMNE